MLYAMLKVVGFGSAGILKGSLVAYAMSAAMAAASPAGAIAICTIVGIGILVAVTCLAIYFCQQVNSFGKPTDPGFCHLTNAQKTPFLLVHHNYRHGSVVQGFATRKEAEKKMEDHKGLRHMLCLYNPSGSSIENRWGHLNPWTELHFGGMNPLVDNAMRQKLRQDIRLW